MEILAPSGNMKSLKCAVYGGADAVYLGLDKFNARIKADNFNCDNIADAVRFCHVYGVKVYVTLNTNVKGSEYEDIVRIIEACAAANVDAFIVTDVGTLPTFDKCAPNIPLHASTQLGIHNAEGAIIAEKLGFSRIVVARETLLSDIREIKRRTSLEVEYFVHGALCVAFSGNCLMSSMINGNSGNRGLCLQPCRKEYSCNGKRGYLLSTSDQCLINDLDALKEVGVDSLKIEGRLRSEHYVYSTVRAYRNMLDSGNVPKDIADEMKLSFNRGNFTRGYNFDDTAGIMSPDIQGNIGVHCGKVLESNGKILTLHSERELKNGDGLKIIAKGKEVGGFSVNVASRIGNVYKLHCDKSFHKGAEVRLTSRGHFECTKRRLEVNMTFNAAVGSPMSLTVSYKGVSVSVNGNTVERARTFPTKESDILNSLVKTGDSCYVAKCIDIHLDGECFIVRSHLNALRRDALTQLENAIISEYDKNKETRKTSCRKLTYAVNSELTAPLMVEIGESADSIYDNREAAYVVSPSMFTLENVKSIINKVAFNNTSAEYILKLPNVARGKDINIIKNIISEIPKICGVFCDNIYALELADEYGKIPVGGIGLNIYSDKHREMLGLVNYVPSVEITLRETDKLYGKKYIYSYGKVPLMTLTHCPVKLLNGSDCSSCEYDKPLDYIDGLGERFTVKRYKTAYCYFKLFNSRTLDAFAKESMKGYNVFVVAEDVEERDGGTTYGHLYKGVK